MFPGDHHGGNFFSLNCQFGLATSFLHYMYSITHSSIHYVEEFTHDIDSAPLVVRSPAPHYSMLSWFSRPANVCPVKKGLKKNLRLLFYSHRSECDELPPQCQEMLLTRSFRFLSASPLSPLGVRIFTHSVGVLFIRQRSFHQVDIFYESIPSVFPPCITQKMRIPLLDVSVSAGCRYKGDS